MDVRLYDVFFSGPIYIYIGTLIKNNQFLQYFMIVTGIMNILYNGHNYLYFRKDGQILPFFKYFLDKKYGKTQIHRLWNLLGMYPIFFYIYWTQNFPQWLSTIFLFEIVIGFGFNLYNFIKLL